MKTKLTVLFIFAAFAIHAQENNPIIGMDSIKTRDSIAAIQEEDRNQRYRQAIMRHNGGWHGDLTIFTGDLEFNFCNLQLLHFLDNYMNMKSTSQEVVGNHILVKVKKFIQQGQPHYLNLNYTVHQKGRYYFIDKVLITGTAKEIVELYVHYWDTTLKNSNLKSGEVVYNYQFPDRIALKKTKNGNMMITIERTNRLF